MIRGLADQVFPPETPLLAAICWCGAVGIALQVTGLAAYAWRFKTVGTLPTQPGERLWIADAAAFVLRLLPFFGQRLLQGVFRHDHWVAASYATYGLPLSLSLGALLAAAIYAQSVRTPPAQRWRITFALNACTQLVTAAAIVWPLLGLGTAKVLWYFVLGSYAAQLAAVTIALTLDLMFDRRQTAEHWIGASLPLWNAGVLAATAAMYVYIHDVE